MGYNMTQKILMRGAGRELRTGEILLVTPDVILTHETGTAGAATALEGRDFVRPHPDIREYVMMSDHFVPAHTVQDAENQRRTRRLAGEWGTPHYYEIGRAGICHQVMPEKGHVRPGELVVVTDAHATAYGGLGCMGIGVGVTDMAMILLSGKLWLRVPRVLGVRLTGRLREGVSAKDLAIRLLRDIPLDKLNYWVVEFLGPGVGTLSVDSRFCLCNMISEGGVKSALLGFDAPSEEFLRPRTGRDYQPIQPDKDAAYDHLVELDLSQVEPMVAKPHHPTYGAAVSEVVGKRINQAFIGSCTNGRMEDLRAAAAVLRGRKVAPHVRLFITPATQEIMVRALEEGLIQTFMESEAVVTNPTCGACIGAHGLLGRGRSASPPPTATSTGGWAASTRRFTWPPPPPWRPPPSRGRLPRISGKGVGAMERIVIENRVIEVMGDHVDTDVISPTQYVSLFEEAEVAKHVFEFYAPSFRDKARAGGILVAGANFGCGSAREQAATGLKGAGVELILARSCSRSFYRNAVNVGLPVVEVDNLPEGFAGEGDRVRVDLAAGLLENRSAGRSLSFAPPHPFVLAVMRAGGIFAFYEATGNYRNLDHLGESPLITQ